jgi:hypothetical protein
MLQSGRSPFRVPYEVDFSIYLILPAELWPWRRLSHEQKWVPGIFLGVKSGRRVGLTTLPPSVSRMSENVEASNSRNPKGLHGLYRDNFSSWTVYPCKIVSVLKCSDDGTSLNFWALAFVQYSEENMFRKLVLFPSSVIEISYFCRALLEDRSRSSLEHFAICSEY